MSMLALRLLSCFIALASVGGVPSLLFGAEVLSAGCIDEETLRMAGLESDGPSLLAFLHARSRAAVDPDHLRILPRQSSASDRQRSLATIEFLDLRPLALPTLGRAALSGKLLVEVNALGARTAIALPNSHSLVVCQQNPRIFEVDRSGKVVGEIKASGPVIRAWCC